MGVPVVAFPIGGQAELISQTPSVQFMAEDTSAKAFIKATIRVASLTKREVVHVRGKIIEPLNIATVAKGLRSLKAVLSIVNRTEGLDSLNNNLINGHH